MITNTALLATGTIEIVPPAAGLTLFIYGWKRVVPVKLTALSITETMHDPRLNPIRARCDLSMHRADLQRLAARPPGLLDLPGPPGGQGDLGGARLRLRPWRRARR